MEPKFQTSFIPKSPVSTTGPTVRPLTTSSSSISFLPSIATVLFVAALLAWGGLFFWEKSVDSQIAQASQALVLAKAAFDTPTIDKLTVASEQIKSAKTLINNHIAVSNMFAVLEANVLPKVHFTTFLFERSPIDNTIKVTIGGEAVSYAVAAEQSALLSKISYLKNQTFTNLDLTDKGAVSIKYNATLDPSLVSYAQAIQALSADTTTSAVTPAATTTSASSTVDVTNTVPTSSL